jgi:MOSC domain-containing protein YiiM
MELGRVEGIFIAEDAAKPMVSLNEVRAIAGSGLEGDRYFKRVGTYSNDPRPGREITLIEVEAIESAKRDYGIVIQPGKARRNIVTRQVALNHLVGVDFKVGEVHLRGIRLCEPCSHLEQLTCAGLQKALIHRGGLRAEILRTGIIRVSDRVSTITS